MRAAQRAVVVEQRQRHDHVRPRRPPELRRQHTDDLEDVVVEADRTANDRRIRAEASPPQLIGEQDDALTPDRFFLGAEIAAERRRHPEHPQKRRRDFQRADTLGLAVAGQVVRARRRLQCVCRHRRERAAVAPPVEVVGRRDGAEPAALARPLLGQRDDPIGTRVWQRPPQHGVDDAEDRSSGADPERQRDQRHDRKPGLAPQHPHGENHVLSQSIPHRGDAPQLLCNRRHSASVRDALPSEGDRDANRLGPHPQPRAQRAAAIARPQVLLDEIAGNRLDEIARQHPPQQQRHAARKAIAHASTLSSPRHKATRARRPSFNASTARGRSA